MRTQSNDGLMVLLAFWLLALLGLYLLDDPAPRACRAAHMAEATPSPAAVVDATTWRC